MKLFEFDYSMFKRIVKKWHNCIGTLRKGVFQYNCVIFLLMAVDKRVRIRKIRRNRNSDDQSI